MPYFTQGAAHARSPPPCLDPCHTLVLAASIAEACRHTRNVAPATPCADGWIQIEARVGIGANRRMLSADLRTRPFVTKRFLLFLSAVAVVLSFAISPAAAQSVSTRTMRSAVSSGRAVFVARMSAAQTLRLDLVLPLRDSAGLQSFLADVYNPASPNYRRYLTPTEFTARFGPTQDQYDTVLRFAKNYGLEVVGGSRDGMDVQVKGTVARVETAFHVSMRVYQHPTESRTFYAPDAQPQLDLPFNLWHISGLDNYSLPHPLYSKRSDYAAAHGIASQAVVSHATTGSGPSASYLGSDMRAAYYGSGSLTGAGQNLALLEYVGTNLADVTTYYKNAGQTNSVPISQVSVDGASTTCNRSSGCDDTEQTLDITQALGMAPGLASLVLYVGNSDTAIMAAMTTHNPLPTTIGCSWGWTPVDPAALDPYFQKMAAQGQTFFAASGDSATWSSSNQAWPADDAYVVSVGGTDLVTASAHGAWKSETAWANSGGGISSTHTVIPAWQKLSGVVTASNHGSTTYRNGPDVSANADYTFYVCANQGTCTANAYGGTSFAAPMWAGYLALVNQQLAANGKSPAGFINPTIYAQSITSSYGTNFHDIASGTAGSYSAVAGYDLVTGWGSPNSGLLSALTGSGSVTPGYTVTAAASSVSVAQGKAASVKFTSAVTGGYSSPVAFTATGAPSGVTIAFSPASVTGNGSSTLTLTAGTAAAAGTYTIAVKATSAGVTQTLPLALTVTLPPSFSVALGASSASVVQGNKATATVTSTALYGFNSAVALTATGAPTGVTVAFSPASVTGSASSTMTITAAATAAAGKYTLTINGTSGATVKTATLGLVVTVAPAYSLASSVKSVSIAQGASNSAAITSTVVGGFSSAVALSTSGAPAGVTLALSPASISGAGSSTLSIAVGTTAPTGTYTVTVKGTSGATVKTITFTLVVTAAPNFTLTSSVSNISLKQGATGSAIITVASVGGFSSAVALTASGTPSGVTLAFSAASIKGAGTSKITATAGSTVAVGSYPITITGTSGSIVRTARFTLVVSVAPNFSLGTSVSAVTLSRTASARVTISTAAVGGFNSSVALSVTGTPAGVAASFSPASIAGGGSSTLTLTAGSSVAAGSYSLIVRAASGSLVHTVTVPLTIASTAATGRSVPTVGPIKGHASLQHEVQTGSTPLR